MLSVRNRTVLPGCGLGIRQLEIAAHVEPVDNAFEIRGRVVLPENHLQLGLSDQISCDRLRTFQFAFVVGSIFPVIAGKAE